MACAFGGILFNLHGILRLLLPAPSSLSRILQFPGHIMLHSSLSAVCMFDSLLFDLYGVLGFMLPAPLLFQGSYLICLFSSQNSVSCHRGFFLPALTLWDLFFFSFHPLFPHSISNSYDNCRAVLVVGESWELDSHPSYRFTTTTAKLHPDLDPTCLVGDKRQRGHPDAPKRRQGSGRGAFPHLAHRKGQRGWQDAKLAKERPPGR